MAELIVALDFESTTLALRLVDDLPGLEWAKIGPMLFVEDGPGLVRELKARGINVFLDLKWHDIPNSVAGAVRSAADLGVDLVTVHALGGPDMVAAARAASGSLKIAAVTVLTAHSATAYWSIVGREESQELGHEVTRLASMAVAAGAHAVVSSPWEVAALSEAIGPEPWIVVPGIRPVGATLDDQRRTADPGAVVRAGATHLVVGRPITRAKCPAEVYEGIRREMR